MTEPVGLSAEDLAVEICARRNPSRPPTGRACGICREDAAMFAASDWLAARLAAAPRDGELAALAHEAISAIGGSHNHWREGGAGGTCRACESANERQDELRARLRALLAAHHAGTGPGGGTT